MLTHLFSPALCAECRLCCNFRPSSAWETPYLEPKLADRLRSEGIPLVHRRNGSISFALHFLSDDPEECCNCPMLDTGRGCTLPRAERPFECRVWPLRLMHVNNSLAIGCYNDCPALSGDVKRKLVDYACGELLPTLLNYARQHPESIRDADPHYAVLMRVE